MFLGLVLWPNSEGNLVKHLVYELDVLYCAKQLLLMKSDNLPWNLEEPFLWGLSRDLPSVYVIALESQGWEKPTRTSYPLSFIFSICKCWIISLSRFSKSKVPGRQSQRHHDRKCGEAKLSISRPGCNGKRKTTGSHNPP